MRDDSPDLPALIEVAAQTHPDFDAGSTFATFLGDKHAAAPESATLHAADLLVAHATARGIPAALTHFERTCIAPIDRVLSTMRLSSEAVDEIKQRVRTKLLVAEAGATPKILDYAGRGALRNWVGVVATREALSSIRGPTRTHSDNALMELESPAVGPELDYLKEHYRDAFATAFAAALSDLTPQARNVLRHHYVHAMTIDQIGTVYGVHRSNAARRISKARDELLSGTRRRLVLGLGVDRREFESIMRLIESRLDVSLRGSLGRE